MLTYPWKCTVLHCNHLGNTWKPLVLMTRHFDYCPSASEGDNQSVRSSAPVVSRCFPGGYNVKLYISRGRLAWWLLAFLHSVWSWEYTWTDMYMCSCVPCNVIKYTMPCNSKQTQTYTQSKGEWNVKEWSETGTFLSRRSKQNIHPNQSCDVYPSLLSWLEYRGLLSNHVTMNCEFEEYELIICNISLPQTKSMQ